MQSQPQPGLQLVSRREWGARKPLGLITPVRRAADSPAQYIRLTYTGTTSCRDLQECKTALQELQSYHIYIHILYDIAYNFLIGADGVLFNGRGWPLEADRPPKYSFLKGLAIDIALIGDYKDHKPPWSMIGAAMDVIHLGIKEKEIVPNYKILSFMDDEATNIARRKIEKKRRRAALKAGLSLK